MKFSESADLKPYPAYKTSSIPWTGEIPAHWEISHLRYFCECLDGKRIPLSAENREAKQGRIPYWGANSVIDHINEWIFDEPLVLVGEDGAPFNDRTRSVAFFVNEKVWVNNHIHVLRCRKELRPEFLVHILNSVDYNNFISGSTRDKLTQQKLLDIPIQLAPATEQSAIVRYLDEADQQIHAYISAKERLISLLEEQRQAIIHQVVTRGLDPNVRLKPSGVEWLGHVPEHWEVKPLKQWVTINEAVLPETTGPDFHFRYLEIGAVTAGEILEEPKKIKFADAPSRARRIVKSSDTIVSTVRTYLKAIWFAERLEEPLICSTGFAVITPREGTVPRFVSYIIQDNNFTDRITAESTGTGYPAISESRLAALKVCVPSASEQAQIIQQLDGVTTSLNESIKHARRQIELMGEYRTRLIADVVTGKLDVRKAAEKLS